MKGVAIAVLVFGVISCLGFLVPGEWWGGLGGVLAVIGASVLLCCTGSGASASAGSHIGAGVLIASAAIVHAVAVIVYIVFWANVVNAVNLRANLLEASNIRDQAALDPYTFVREAYRQQREFKIYDGNPPGDEFDDYLEGEGDSAILKIY